MSAALNEAGAASPLLPDLLARCQAGLTAAQDKRIAGLGIAMPFELWNWADTAGAPREIMDQWRHRDIRSDIQALCGLPVYLQNDATAACGAELVFGQTGGLRDFIYFYIGAFAGGGIVLSGRLYSGSTGNAGGNHNLILDSTGEDFPALLRKMGRGLLVTELLGMGVNQVTGDYSRGAAGFWVENGEIAYPVQEITIAANLKDIFKGILAVGRDVVVRGSRQCGSILIDRMTVAGE